jgi:two-component system chemotaxis response regulator CheY
MTALLMMARRNYALVICDLVMEPVSDVNLLKTVRADEVLRKTKFLIMTAHGSSEDVVQARAAGVDSYIVKSFAPEALKAKIKKHI